METLVSLQAQACILRSRIQRVNGSLGSVMTEPNVMSSSSPSLSETLADSDLRWRNSLLAQVVVQMAKEEEIDVNCSYLIALIDFYKTCEFMRVFVCLLSLHFVYEHPQQVDFLKSLALSNFKHFKMRF